MREFVFIKARDPVSGTLDLAGRRAAAAPPDMQTKSGRVALKINCGNRYDPISFFARRF
ncbi:hypothetical protein U8P76_15390 [Rhizobium johnstonii]|uniref:hypothetical protein n=1 Tax=Rhizobium leguminosarum TaxID=384 RepID=UPI0013BEF0B2|nr:hypothetical protein [Rhizobium leguminosarum]NEH96736.1 hypothetical protein [Rhizobium leguminosarum]NEJ46900.1 hypothetical protein [Rhizobium leguminosarum]NEJ50245.1 hypothetical protein [Rhizobium leguminosarum]WSG94068.1 hypothetical protein U8P76_15390 [Rhizobium johnstonii]